MSTATFPTNRSLHLVPAVKELPFANEISALYGPIPNAHTRVLCPSERGAKAIRIPAFPMSAREHESAFDINCFGEHWRQTLASSRDIAIWDVPTDALIHRNRVPINWSDHFRGLLTKLRYEPQPKRDPQSRVRPIVTQATPPVANDLQGVSPYQHYRWFQVQRQTTDARQLSLRKVYPRAYEHWSEEEKRELRNRIQNGDSFDVVAHDLRRQPEAVSVAVWRLSTQLAMEHNIPKPEKLQLAASGTGLPEPDVAHILPATPVVDKNDYGPQEWSAPEPRANDPSRVAEQQTPIRVTTKAATQHEPAMAPNYPSPISATADDDHDPTPCEYVHRLYRQTIPRDPNAILFPDDFPPLMPEPTAQPIHIATAAATPRRASPTAVFSMAQAVRNSLKAQGVGTKQISLIADVLRQVQES